MAATARPRIATPSFAGALTLPNTAPVQRVPTWNPDRVMVPGETFDELFFLNPENVATILNEGAMHTANPFYVLDPSQPVAELAAGPDSTKSVRTKASGGLLRYPIDGILPSDEFTIELAILSIGADATAQPGNTYMLFSKAGIQQIAIYHGSTAIIGRIDVTNSGITGGPAAQSMAAILNISVGDIPADTWKRLSLTYDGTQVIMRLGGLQGSPVTDVSKSQSATLFPVGSSTPLLKRQWSGDPFALVAQGLGVQTEKRDSSSADSNFRVGSMAIRRYARTIGRQSFKKPATITFDAGTTSGAFPRYIGGLNSHYTGWSDTEASVTSTTVHNAQIAACKAAGCALVRLTEFNKRAIPTWDGSSNTVSSVVFTNLDAEIDRFAGYDFHLHLGYCPDALNASAGRNVPPTNNAAFADYCSKVVAHIKAYAPGRLKSLSFWNEPSLATFWNGTLTQFKNLWLAVAQKLAVDHPDLPLGGPDAAYEFDYLGNGQDVTYQRGVMDIAAANGLQVPYLYLHHYRSDTAMFYDQIADLLAYAASKSLTAPQIRVTEWSYSLSYGQQSAGNTDGRSIPGIDQRHQTPFHAAYAHAHIKEMIDRGVDMACFFRLGQQATYSTSVGAEESEALIDSSGVPWPVFGAFSMIWKHRGTKVSATSNWPGVRALATSETDGSYLLTYSSFRPWRQKDRMDICIEWTGLPAKFQWKHYQIDHNHPEALGALVDSGTEANLPTKVSTTATGMGLIQVYPG